MYFYYDKLKDVCTFKSWVFHTWEHMKLNRYPDKEYGIRLFGCVVFNVGKYDY